MFPKYSMRIELLVVFLFVLAIIALAAHGYFDPLGVGAGGSVLAAHFVWKDPHVSLGGVDLSDHVKQATLNYSAEAPDDTTGGDSTRNRLAGGLKDWSLTLELAQDYAASEVDATLFSLVGTSVAIVLRPTTDAVGTTNPSYSGNAILTAYQPFGGQIGAQAMAPVTFEGNGDLSRATS